jgi:hypothetical protein
MTRWLLLGVMLATLLGACGRYGRPVRPKAAAPTPPAPPTATLEAEQSPAPAPAPEVAEDDEEE